MLTHISRSKKPDSFELVELLLECHARIRLFVSLAREAGRRTDAPEQETVDACLRVERYFTEALPLHLADEEQSIQPRLRACCSEKVKAALETMAEQHTLHEPKTQALLSASAAVRENPGDLELRAVLMAAACELEREFSEHLQLEETLIFPAIHTEIPKDEQDHIVQELRLRRVSRDLRLK